MNSNLKWAFAASIVILGCDSSGTGTGGGGGSAGGGEGNGGTLVDAEVGGGVVQDAGPGGSSGGSNGGSTGGSAGGASGGSAGGAGGAAGGSAGGAGGSAGGASGGSAGGASGGEATGGSNGGSVGGSNGGEATGGAAGGASGGEATGGAAGGASGGQATGGASGGEATGGNGTGGNGTGGNGTGGAVGGEVVPADAGIELPDAAHQECIGPGGFTQGDLPCCEGLATACPNEFFNIACGEPCDGPQVCVECGDGLCGEGEDPCNCAGDCMEVPVDCIPLGGRQVMGSPATCCPGLFPARAIEPTPDNMCVFAPGGDSICVVSNNNDCGVGENFCNAVADCPAPIVPCSENGEAVDAQAGSCCDAQAFMMPDTAPAADGVCVFSPNLICAISGDANCGPGENFCNSPVDCPAPPPPCVSQGQPLNPAEPQSACCEGLASIGCSSADADGVCRQECVGVTYCAACGNGLCEGAPNGAENACNCPADCGAVPGCVAAGGNVPVIPNAPSCCPGYGTIGCESPGPNGACQPCVGAARCAQCGDGVCTAEEGENRCNCARDCNAQ